jgi:segregation and condensation protein A
VSALTPTVRLGIFEGPLDLLLHLIKRNEVEITDIPIATITDQYLAMLGELPELNLDGAGEYLVMAATLMYIKSRMLLPSTGEDEEAEEDPRAELVQQLMEYQRYREVAVALGERNVLARDVFAAPGEPVDPATAGDDLGPTVRDASLGDLLDALRDVLKRITPSRVHEIEREAISLRECVQQILGRFALAGELEFTGLFDEGSDRGHVIVTFLALLELIRLRVVRARQADHFGPIVLTLALASLAEATERVRDLVDDEAWRARAEEVEDGHGADTDR